MTDPLKVSVQNVMGPGTTSGWLTKQSEHIRAWRRMWFVLSGHYLYWFKSLDAREAKGLIELELTSTAAEAAVKSKSFAFQITTQSRNHAIVASSQQEMESWVIAIRAAIEARAHNERTKVRTISNPLHSLMSAFDLSTELERLRLEPTIPLSGASYLTERQEGRLKKMLLEQLLETEIIYFRDGPNLDKLKNVQYLRLLFELFIVKCPIFRSQPPVFWNSLNNLMNNLPRLSRIEQRGEKSKRDRLFRKLQKVGLMFFYNSVRTQHEVNRKKPIYLGYDTPDAPKVPLKTTEGVPIAVTPPPSEVGATTPQTPVFGGRTKREEFLAAESKAYYKLLQGLIGELVTPGGLSKFLTALKANKTYNTLPEEYRVVFDKTQEFMCYYLEGALANDARYARLKKMYDTIPFTALPAILAIANPMKLLSGLLGLALAKPLGARNLLQRIVKIMVLNPLEAEIDRLRKDIRDANIFLKVKNFVSAMFSDANLLSQVAMDSADPRTNVERVLTTPLVQPVINKATVDGFQDGDVGAVFQLIQILVKEHDSRIVIDALGDDNLIGLVRELFPVLQAPLMELFAQGNISQLISKSLKFFQKLMRIAEAKRKAAGLASPAPSPTTHHAGGSPAPSPAASSGWFTSFRPTASTAPATPIVSSTSEVDLSFDVPAEEIKPEDIGKEYVQAVTEFVGDFYGFLHRLAANDKGLLQDLLQWMLEIFNFVQNGAWAVDFHVLLERVPPEQRAQLAEEVNQFDLYRASKAEKKSRKIQSLLNRDNVVLEKIHSPKLVLTPALAQQFHKLVLAGLTSEYAQRQNQPRF